jgi:hypothetical protein
MTQPTERWLWADEMFDRIDKAVVAKDPFALYGLIADPQPRGFGDRATADEAVTAMMHSDNPDEIGMVLGLFQGLWDNPMQDWPTLDDLL